MTEATMKRLVDAAGPLGIDCSPYPDYSGRGMYGKTTCGVVVASVVELATVAASAGHAMPEDEFEDFIEEVQNASTDSMGRRFIAY